MAITDIITRELFLEYMSFFRVILDYIHIFFDSGFYVLLYMMAFITLGFLLMAIIVCIFGKRYKEKQFIPEKAPFVTIQIPTKNEIIALRCAEKCLNFDYPKNKFEILIGDDSDDKSVSNQLVAFAKKHSNICIIKRKENVGYKPGNLQNMLQYSKGEILVIFDSDYIPEKDFLKRIVTPFIYDKSISVVQSRWNFYNYNQNFVTIMSSTIGYVFHHITLSFLQIFGTTSLCGSAEAVKKKDLIQLGGWKVGSLTEDIEYTLRLQTAGKKIVYLDKLECNGEAPFTAKDFFKQQMRWAYGVVHSYIINFKCFYLSNKISLWRKMVSSLPGIGYLIAPLITFLFFFGILSFVTHTPEAFDIAKFAKETGFNILITSGLIVASIIALLRAKRTKTILKMIVASFSVGIVAIYYVDKGIAKCLLNKQMGWFLLKKETDYKKLV